MPLAPIGLCTSCHRSSAGEGCDAVGPGEAREMAKKRECRTHAPDTFSVHSDPSSGHLRSRIGAELVVCMLSAYFCAHGEASSYG